MRSTFPEGTEALIFDMDGTLVDSTPVHFAAWSQTLAEVGITLDREFFDAFYGRTNPEILEEVERATGKVLSGADLGRRKDRYFSNNVTMVQPNQPVLEIVEGYHGSLPLAVATNESLGIANMVLRATGLAHHFELLVSGDEVDRPKPAPDLFIECARRLQVAPGACHVFEDSRYGIEAAQAAGMSVTDVRRYL